MSNTINALNARLNRLLHNGKNTDGSGVIRKIRREIRHAEQDGIRNAEKKQ